MRKNFFWTGLLSQILVVTGVYATEIGIIEIEQLNKSIQVEDATKRLEKEFSGRKEEFEHKHDAWKKKQHKLQKDKDILSQVERKKLESESQKLQSSLAQLDEKFRAEYSARYQDEMEKFQKVLKTVVAQLIKDEKLDIVLPNQAVIDFSPKVNVTEKVLAALAKLPLEKPIAQNEKTK